MMIQMSIIVILSTFKARFVTMLHPVPSETQDKNNGVVWHIMVFREGVSAWGHITTLDMFTNATVEINTHFNSIVELVIS